MQSLASWALSPLQWCNRLGHCLNWQDFRRRLGAPERAVHEAVKVQDAGEARTVGGLKKVTGSEQNHPKRKAARAVAGSAQGQDCHWAFTSLQNTPQFLETEVWDLMFAVMSFPLVLVPFFSLYLFVFFEMQVLALCHCMPAVFNFFYFYRGSQLRVWLGAGRSGSCL